MPAPADEMLVQLLKAIEQSAPDPLYPAAFAALAGLERSQLDQVLDQLRLRGLVRLTDWVRDKGQGYALTSQGATVLKNPVLLKRGQLPVPDVSPPPDRSFTAWDRGEAVREVLLSPTRPVVTTVLLAVNILVFLAGLVIALHKGASVSDYLGSGNRVIHEVRDDMGALVPREVLAEDQWWRLVTYAFIHGGLFHLLMNMYALYSLGPLLETLWGSVRFLALYLVGAVTGGSVVMVATDPRGLVVGASGAICGLLTSLGVWVYLNRDALRPRMVSNWMRNVFANIFLMVIISTVPGVSWQGHLGGALGGALVSLPLNYQRFGRGWQRILGLVGVAAVPALFLGWVAYELEPIVDEVKVRYYLQPAYNAAEEQALKTFPYALALLNSWNEVIDPGRVDPVRQAFQDAQQKLQEALDVFDQMGPYQDEDVADAVARAHVYLEEWSKFYALFASTVMAPSPWPEEQREALVHQGESFAAAADPLKNSPLFPAHAPRLSWAPKNKRAAP